MNVVLAVFVNIPIALVFIALGLLLGTILNEKAVGGICGALLTNLSAWLSGVWFDLALVGGVFETLAGLLPFMHGAELEKALFAGDFSLAATHILPILLYSASITVFAVFSFLRQMNKQ